MKKALYCLLIITIALTVVSCGGKELASINPGLYEIEFVLKYAGQPIVMKQRVRYNSDGTYEATNFQNNIAVEELKGKFKIENKWLVSSDNYARLITKDDKWTQKGGTSKVEVRKIKKGSYQYYFEFPSEQVREKNKGLGISEGWKTYTRISD